MSGLLSYIPGLGSLAGSRPKSIDLQSVEIHHVETSPDRRARCLKHLLKANHVNHAVIYNNLQWDNHCPHLLSSAYLLGANENQLNAIYDDEAKQLEPWTPSPSEIIDNDWTDFLGNKHYQRAFLDYFEDKLVMEFAYDWKKLLGHFLYSGPQPLLHGLIGGLGHPLIHLGYAFEMDSKDLAVEALTLSGVQYNFFHKYLDDPSYTRPSGLPSDSPLGLLIKLSEDTRFDSLPKNPELEDLQTIFEQHEPLILEYWNAWQLEDPTKQFQLSQEAAVALLTETVRPGTHSFDFLIVHLLTTSHAVRVLLPFVPPEHHITLVREWWLLVIAMYLIKGRPRPDPDNVDRQIGKKSWVYVEHLALTSPYSKDAHYVKAIRSMKAAAFTWGDVHDRYLASAVYFVDNFRGWVH